MTEEEEFEFRLRLEQETGQVKAPQVSKRSFWQMLDVPRQKSQEGLNMIAEVTPSFEPTGNMVRDVALNAPKVVAETLAETAPDFVSRSAMIGGAAGKVLSKAEPVVNFAGRQASKLGRVLSGNKPEDIQALFKRPGAFVAPSLSKAKEIYGEAIESAGPKLEVSTNEAFESASKTARKVINQLKDKPDTVDELTALEGRRALDEVISSTRSSRKKARLFEYRQQLDGIVKQNPEIAAADKIYADSALASKFRNIQAVNLNGTPSVLRSTLAAGISGFIQNPLPFVFTSPMTIGAATAGLGLVKRGIQASGATKSLGRLGLVGGSRIKEVQQ